MENDAQRSSICEGREFIERPLALLYHLTKDITTITTFLFLVLFFF